MDSCLCGSSILAGLEDALILLVTVSAAYGYYYHLAVKEFGGTTGDIAGFFVQVCELMMAGTVMLGGKFL